MVQIVFTGPRGLLDSQASQAPPKTITQSMCRTFDPNSKREISTCINCKSACLDIDSEKAYWTDLTKPGRKLVQYGYLGLAIGYFAYYYLYAGNFAYYFSGVWTHEENQLATLWKPGFYLFERAILIPKLVAVPLTLTMFVVLSCLLCRYLEKILFSWLKQRDSVSDRQGQHRMFSLCTFLAFNIFFIYGGRPEILRLPLTMQWLFNALIVLVSTLWLYRTWNYSFTTYTQNSLGYKERRQLQKLEINWSELLEGRSLDRLKPNELYVLAQILPSVTQRERRTIYQGILEEALAENRFTPAASKLALSQLRQKLNISDTEHERILDRAIVSKSQLFSPTAKQIDRRELSKDRTNRRSNLGNHRSSTHELPTQIKNPKPRNSDRRIRTQPTIQIQNRN